MPQATSTADALSRNALRSRLARFPATLANWPLPALFLLFVAAVALGHLTLLRLPYYWDEGGYYIPAALDFYHHGTLIPEFTNAHPPLPNVVLGTVWHLFGFHILVTRLTVCAAAATGLLAVFRLTLRLLGPATAAAVTILTSVYPIWYTQSSLAHADIFAAAFTLAALAVCFARPEFAPSPHLPLAVRAEPPHRPTARFPPLPHALRRGEIWAATLFSLSVVSKETAIVWPATLAALELLAALRTRDRSSRRLHLRWLLACSLPVLPLLAWYAYHRAKTGFTFGNPEYLRYNATANLTATHLFTAFRYRFLHLFTQRNMWLPLLLALACLLLPRRIPAPGDGLSRPLRTTVALLILANWLFFSVLGGALLTRYLLPVYPLLLLLCVDVWRARLDRWPLLALLTAVAFISGWWLSPATSFAPEDCLVYRDMIVTHQEAIAFIDQHYPDATVLTAWPAAAELFRPDLGYTDRRIRVTSIENFTAAQISKAAAEPDHFDTALVFTTHYLPPTLAARLLANPNSWRGRQYAADRDLRPAEIAAQLGGKIVFLDDRNGEWAAVLRFNRRYEAELTEPSHEARIHSRERASAYVQQLPIHERAASGSIEPRL